MASRCLSRKGAKITLSVASIGLVACVVILLVFPTIYKKQLTKDIALSDGSLVTKIWEDIPLPIYEKLYFFNITNGDEFLKKGEPLNVTEIGPYTYVAKWVKHEPQWNPNGTVSYREVRTYQFVPDQSVGSQDDKIHTLNGPMIIAADILRQYNIAFRIAASFFLKLFSEQVITEKRVRELAYDGYEDIIIRLAPVIEPNIPFKGGIFSWLYGKNATDDGVFTVFTGAEDASNTNFISRWNGQERLTFWKGDTCNMINGTSIETGPPLGDTPDPYTFFQSIFCRSLTFNYTRDNEHFGVRTKRFEPNENIFANGSENPDNACFDLVEGRASGVLDVRPCQFGAPVLISFPHFHMADPSYLKSINGLEPNNGEHGSYMEVEPITGLSVNMKIRFQVNLQMTRTRGILQLDDVPEGIFPVFWASIEIQLTEHWADFLKSSLNTPKVIVYSVLGVLAFVCTILIIGSIVFLQLSRKQDEEDDPLLDVKEEHKDNLGKRTISTNSETKAFQRNDDFRNFSAGIMEGVTNEGSSERPIYSTFENSEQRRDLPEDDVPVLPINPTQSR